MKQASRVVIWVDVRIARLDFARAALLLARVDSAASIDLRPPASGPEIEITFGPFDPAVDDGAESRIVAAFELARINVLVSRERPWEQSRAGASTRDSSR